MSEVGLPELNAADKEGFVRRLGGIFEHSPWVAERAYDQRPFATVTELHAAMVDTVHGADEARRLELLRAHPDLAGRASMAAELTAASRSEQSGAGLDRLSEEQYHRFHDLNDRYRAKFGFPFILAVKGHNAQSILAAFESRLENSREVEIDTALREVFRIARFRLEDGVHGPK